jgi:tRNA1(Val) A37 N6-methylase TrmN6
MHCCVDTQAIDAYFDERKARRESEQYLRKGLAAHAKAMLAAVSGSSLQGASVLEIGGGIGGLQIELLQRGAAHATNVEVSTAYLAAAQTLAGQLGLADRVSYHRGDITRDTDAIPAADMVIMHRVICCYPDMPSLVSVPRFTRDAAWR